MINRICLLLEALSIVICLHHLYGKKFRLDIATVSFLAVDMIVMTVINSYDTPKITTVIIYPIIFVYCLFKFHAKVKENIVNIVLCIFLIGCVQFITMAGYLALFKTELINGCGLLVIGLVTFIFVLCVLKKCKLERVSIYLQRKEKIIQVALAVCVIILLYCIIGYKKINYLEIYQYAFMFANVILICVLIGQLGKAKVQTKEIETELKMHKLYSDSFYSLIENIRMRQHEFDNQINTIYSQHYIYETYEELVNAQKQYCQAVTKENKYNKLLSAGKSIIVGFLYGKFLEIDKKGIEISYKVDFSELTVNIPSYKIIEIIGNLIDNAVEAVITNENANNIFVYINEKNGIFEIEIANESNAIEYTEMITFFSKGYSKKENHRGYGLYNVKKICDEYGLDIVCTNKIIDDIACISFCVTNKKETAKKRLLFE